MTEDLIKQFYEEIDVFTRKSLLKEAIASGENAEDNELRRQIYNNRYLPKKAAKKDPFPYIDTFYGLWIPLTFHQKNTSSERQFKKASKEILKELDKFHYFDMRNGSERMQELLFWEFVNFFRNFIATSRQDRSYGSRLFGITHLKGEKLEKQIREDIELTAIELPAQIGLENELKPFIEAARYVIKETFENVEEEPKTVAVDEDSVRI